MQKYFFILALISSLPLFAQKTKTVEGEYKYHVPENVTLEAAKRTALDRAKIQAIADEFGTLVSQDNATRISNKDGKSEVDFISIGGSDVKGEWIETEGEPEFKILYGGDQLIIWCKVKGKAREIVKASIDIQAHVLRNGIDNRFESDHFKDGDAIYLSFQSPIKGFLAVYLVDDDGLAFCLLPYRNQKTDMYSIEANQRYLFFNEAAAPRDERPYVENYYLTCNRTAEHNQIYIVFSPNEFYKPIDKFTQQKRPRQLSFKDFQKWLSKCQNYDKEMNVKRVSIMIEKEK